MHRRAGEAGVGPAGESCSLARRGDFAAASAEYDRRVDLADAGHDVWRRAALLRLWLGDVQGYRDRSRRMFARFLDTTNVGAGMVTAWTCLLMPDTLEDMGPLVRYASRARQYARTARDWQVVGLASLRGGDAAAAVADFQKADELADGHFIDVETLSLLATAHVAVGRHDEACRHLQAAQMIIATQFSTAEDSGMDWERWLICHLLYEHVRAAVELDEAAGGKARPGL